MLRVRRHGRRKHTAVTRASRTLFFKGAKGWSEPWLSGTIPYGQHMEERRQEEDRLAFPLLPSYPSENHTNAMSFLHFCISPILMNPCPPSFHFASTSNWRTSVFSTAHSPFPARGQGAGLCVTYLLFIREEQDGQGHLSEEDDQQQDEELGRSRDMLTALVPVLPLFPLHPGSIQSRLRTCAGGSCSCLWGLHKPPLVV